MTPRGSRTRVLTHQRFDRPPVPDPAQRELSAIRDILHAHLNADRPEETFQFALDRLGPLIGSSFASVYLVDGVSELMRLAAASNWPAKYRPWLGDMRVRVGFGPSGEAVSERRTIEVPDVLAENGLEDWAEVAHELGFRSLVALPLLEGSVALGTVTFYFEEPGSVRSDQRQLMTLVADLLATSAAKIRMSAALRRAESALSDAAADLDAQYAETLNARRGRETFLDAVGDELLGPLVEVQSALASAERSDPLMAGAATAAAELRWRLDELLEFAALRAGATPPTLEVVDPRLPIDQAMRLLADHHLTMRIVDQLPVGLPSLHVDRGRAIRSLASVLKAAWRLSVAGPESRPVLVQAEASARDVSFRITAQGSLTLADANAALAGEFRVVGDAETTGPGLVRARLLAESMGGSVHAETGASGVTFVATFPAAH